VLGRLHKRLQREIGHLLPLFSTPKVPLFQRLSQIFGDKKISVLLLWSETTIPLKGEITITRPGDALRNAPPYTYLSRYQE
jgi:hypothetical protein